MDVMGIRIIGDLTGRLIRENAGIMIDGALMRASLRIRKVRVLPEGLKTEALKLGFDLEDLVVVGGDKLEKVVGDPVSFLLKRSCCEENGIT